MNDTLYWKEIEVLPGSFIGNWDVLSSNGGVEQDITSSNEIAFEENEILLFPSPTQDYFQIVGNQEIYSLNILNLNGQILETFNNIRRLQKVDISYFSTGMYLVQFKNENNKSLMIKKIIKE